MALTVRCRSPVPTCATNAQVRMWMKLIGRKRRAEDAERLVRVQSSTQGNELPIGLVGSVVTR